MKSNQEIVTELYSIFDQGDFEEVREMLTETFTADLVGVSGTLDRDGFIQFGREFRQAFPDGCHQFTEILSVEDRIVTRGIFRGTHLGSFQGLPSTGKSVVVEVIHIDQVVNDRIIKHWGQGNQAGMMEQLGILFVPGLNLFGAALRHRWQSN